MNFIKKYSTLLIPAGIALVALVMFVLVFLSQRSLAKDINDKSLSPHNRIKSVISKVPSAGQADEEAANQSEHARDAAAISLLARQSTQRSLISYKIFPG